MERLLKDAGKIAGKKFNLSNLADVYEAIHVIQTELGITGTTAKEAEGTISGSISTMKAAWKNLLVAFGDPNANLNEKVDAFTKSVGTVVKNVFPVFKRVVQNMWNSLGDFGNSLGELVFGANEAGEVNWPTWDDVKDGAIRAWNFIKEQAVNLGGLVFGRKEDGSVDWPTWDDVKTKASEIWEGIKNGAKALGGLVFGTKEDGSVDWPDVTKLTESFSAWWSGTAQPALQGAMSWTLQLFGMPQESAESISSTISNWWGTIVDTAQSVLKWTLNLPDSPHEAGEQLRGIIDTWWQGVKSTAEGVLKWALGIPEMEDASGTSMKETIKTWWNTQVVPKIKDALNFTLGLFKLPDASAMKDAILAWWELVKQAVGNLVLSVGAIFNPSATANQPKGGRGAYSGEYGYYSGSGANPRTGTTALMNAKGNWDVPYDDFLARLHRGEMVLTASQARRYRDGEEGSSFDMEALVSGIVSAIQTGMQGVTVNSYLSGRSITDDVNRQTVRQLKARRFAT